MGHDRLDRAGVVTRRLLPPPAASTVYELTPAGRELEPSIVALARWGLRLLGEKERGDEFRIEWLAVTLRTMLRPEHAHGPPLTVEFRIGGETLQARIAGGTLETQVGSNAAADVTIVGDVATLAEVARDPGSAAAHASRGELRVSGAAEAIARATKVLGLERT